MQLTFHRLGLSGVLVALALATAADLHAARRGGRGASAYRSRVRRVIQNVQKDITVVQKELKSAQEQLSKDSQTLSAAQSAYKEAKADVERAKKSLHDRLGPSVGLPEAQAAAERAEAAYDDASEQALAQLKSTPEFQAAEQNLQEAEDRLAALRSDKSSGANRKQQLAEAAKTAMEAREAKRKLIDRHPSVKPLRESFDKASARLSEVHAKLQRAIKDDTTLHSAEQEFRRAKQALEEAEAAVATQEVRITALQERLVADHQLIGR
jgi:DNA repair exonuclease SbcCD ATPase subunit